MPPTAPEMTSITSPGRNNAHAKAGNINYAFNFLRAGSSPPDFIAILDARFVPHSDFIARAISLFHNRSVALVQTPQYFFNPDPIQHNLGITQAYPDEQRFFFNYVEPARDAWDIAACCGTSSLFRAKALEEIGGFPTGSVTEDFLVTLRLAEAGYKTVYLNEPLSEGLAAEGLAEYVLQRGRWALGMMQIVRGRYNPLSLKNPLSFRHRLSVADLFFYWAFTFQWRLIGVCIPLLYWYFGICPLSASLLDFFQYFVPYYLASTLILNWISRGLFIPLIPEVAQLVAAPTVCRAIAKGLFTKGPHKFNVTAKGTDRTALTVQWAIMRPFASLLALSVVGLGLPLATDYAPSRAAGEEQAVMLFWSIYNLAVLTLAVMVCFEHPRQAHTIAIRWRRLASRRRRAIRTCSSRMCMSATATLIGALPFEPGRKISIDLPHIGEVSAIAVRTAEGSAAVSFELTDDQRSLLIAKLHASKAPPGVVEGCAHGVALALAKKIAG